MQDRVTWSPDGTRAAVLGDDGLHVCDVAGKLSPVLVPDVRCVAWMPDSKRMVVCIEGESKNWRAEVYEVGDNGATARPLIYQRTFKEHEGIRRRVWRQRETRSRWRLMSVQRRNNWSPWSC